MKPTAITAPSGFVSFLTEDVEQSIVDRFEATAARHANRPAVCENTETWSYDTLNRAANRIANGIVAANIPEKSRVAVYLEKGAACLAAIFGVLKAGHAYVPLDPALPHARNQHVIHDSQATLILTNQANLAAAWALGAGKARIINLDALPADLPDSNPGLAISPDALASLIYTSGSTGKPKGVMQNHRNTLHGCMRRTNLQKLSPSDRMTLFHSCSVMGSVYSIFGALLNGAALFPYDIREDGLGDLANWLRNEHITIYHSVASVFRRFATTCHRTTGSFDIRMIIFGGERVLTSDIDLARKVFSPRCEFFTGLGSTETGTICHLIIDPAATFDSKVLPIGHPVDDMEVILLTDEGRLAEPGQLGEITVRSRFLALGYWNLPEVSSRVFTTDPADPSVRTYRTGDIAFLNSDGLLEHRGRKDFQVKIRGFRVEISEIEMALLDHPAVREALVVAREMGSENHLVAYLVARDGMHLQVRDLRRFLSSRLPSYMVPMAFVGLAALPRTPNDKVDRLALPLPASDNELAEDPAVPPATKTERHLVAVFRELLRLDEVGANHNFFDVGGDSLSATQLVSRVNDHFGVRLPMRAVFEAENLRALAARIDGAAPSAGAAMENRFEAAPRNGRIPLSSSQLRMWLVDRIHPGSAAYNISNTVRLDGNLDVAALEGALTHLVARHEILRTVFPSDASGPWQQILPPAPVNLARISLQHLDPVAREARALELAREALRRHHDLARGPLFHCGLLTLDDTTAVLVLVFNHTIYDNIWSSGIFFRELGAAYAALASGSALDVPPMRFQFADYAHWQQARRSNPALHEDLEYWRKQLAQLPDALKLPADHPRRAQPTLRGGQVSFHVPGEVGSALADLGRAESATMFMVLLAAWQTLLHRYTNQEDILVGTPTGRRYRTETEGMIGLFINTLVLRTDCSGNPAFRDLLARVRQTTIDAFSHDELPFEDLLAELRPGREAGVSPVFQTLFIHRNASNAPWSIPGLQVTPLDAHSGGSKFDLTVSVLETGDQVKGTIEYSSDLFDRSSIECMARNYVALLAAITADPRRPLWSLDLMPAAEHRRIRQAWNQSEAAYPAAAAAHQLFEAQAAHAPEAVAVVCDERSLTYRELNRLANRVARHLQSLGVGPGSLVAVCLHRSPELVAALLGVLKAGGAYLPLDPLFPADRLAYMIDDSAPAVFISQAGIVERFPGIRAERLLVESDSALFDEGEALDPAPTAGPPDLAYVIYTSGSTGKPKGVQLVHQALVNFLASMQKEPGISRDDVLHSITTISFDIAALELFLPLVSGARVVIEPRETSLDPARLLASMTRHRATIMQATPATWRMLLDHGWTGDPRLKVLCGGEAMGTDLAERLLKTGGDVWNLYGPTETTIWSSVARIKEKTDALFLGAPIANTQFHVFSPLETLQPLGVPGELVIGGDGLARGYVNSDELTREKFIDDPFEPGRRVYRTGDLVRRRADGSIEFLGRMDNQVKIRGFRIEPGEIEAVLAEHPAVRQAVVVAREDTPGDQRLVAYVVAADATLATAIEPLRAFVRTRLPDYMRPAAYVMLERVPLTPNGKVDLKALPMPESRRDAADPFIAPRGPVEQLLAEVWCELLRVDRVGALDDFFELGGHSLLATRLVSRVRDLLSAELPLRAIFQDSSLAGVAAAILERAEAPGDVERVAGLTLRLRTLPDEEVTHLLAHGSA